MELRTLGNSDLDITPLGIGAWAIGGAGYAFAGRREVYIDVTALASGARVMTKYEAALVRPGLKGVIAVPIFDNVAAWRPDPAARPVPAAVLCLDSDAGLETEYADAEFMAWLIAASVDLASVARNLGGTE